MATVYWDGSTDGDYSNAANWTGGLPGAADTVIFDGRTTQAVTSNLTEADDLARVHIMPSCTYNIGAGTSTTYWEFQCTGSVIIEGSGTYYIRCGNGTAADTDITTVIVDTSGTVHLASELNANAGNVSIFDEIRVINGTVNIKGKADIADTGGQDGTAFTKLYIAPSSGSTPTVNIGDQCADLKNTVGGDIHINGGTCNFHCFVANVFQYAGTVNCGSTSYSMDGSATVPDDHITNIFLYTGTFNWLPSTVSAGVRTVCPHSPVITAATLLGGTFSATSLLETGTTAPTITDVIGHSNATFNIANGYSNVSVGTFQNFGATLVMSSDQTLNLT